LDASAQPESPEPSLQHKSSDPSAQPESEEPLAPLAAELEALAQPPSAEGPPSIAPPGPPPLGPVIEFNDVSISFDGRDVLRNVSFSVNRGETLCILGRSGVGKSVSLRMLMGFLRPDSGSIRVEGEEITKLGEEGMRAIRKRVTMVFQNGALFDSMSVRENVAFPLRERGGVEEDALVQIVDRLIGLVGAEDVADSLPASLSTGRKRAVAMARALAAQPEVVLYDEPTTMVDPIIAKRLGNLIQRLKQQLGFTSVVVTHDTRFAEVLADSVLFLDKGEARFFGPLKDFKVSQDPDIREFLALDAYELPPA
jgi:phospholipid/cholesterol/gamma-HCH transport system ATP-binding protein